MTVTNGKVAVLRWDQPTDARVFERGSVERSVDRFYGFLSEDGCGRTAASSDHLLDFFRRLRSLGHAVGVPDARATDLFITALARLAARAPSCTRR